MFREETEATGLLRAYLPEAVSRELLWSSIEFDAVSFSDDRLRESESDLLYALARQHGPSVSGRRLERGQRSTSHPYLLYRVGPSREHRAQHLAWDGVLLPKDDPFWAVANPRNGWGCKCSIRFVSRAQHRRCVRAGITYPSQGDQPPRTGKPVETKAPKLQRRRYINKRTGQTHVGYAGIDPGFEDNPGTAREQ